MLDTIARAPFIAPGRRNRRVHWNRDLSRAMAALGIFERQDFQRGLILPASLRNFPQFNNQFSPGGGSGCGCCGGGGDPDCTEFTSVCADEYQIDFTTFGNNGCPNCDSDFSDTSYIVTRVPFNPIIGACHWNYYGSGDNCQLADALDSFPGVQLELNGTAAAVHMLVVTGGARMLWEPVVVNYNCASWNLEQFDDNTPSNLACFPCPTCYVTAL